MVGAAAGVAGVLVERLSNLSDVPLRHATNLNAASIKYNSMAAYPKNLKREKQIENRR